MTDYDPLPEVLEQWGLVELTTDPDPPAAAIARLTRLAGTPRLALAALCQAAAYALLDAVPTFCDHEAADQVWDWCEYVCVVIRRGDVATAVGDLDVPRRLAEALPELPDGTTGPHWRCALLHWLARAGRATELLTAAADAAKNPTDPFHRGELL